MVRRKRKCDFFSENNKIILLKMIFLLKDLFKKVSALINPMREVFLVSADHKSKVEDMLKKDDEIARGSINVRSAASLDIEEDGYFIILDASHERIEKAKHLIHEFAKPYAHAKKVLDKFDEQENAAIEGFGNILG